MRKKYTIWQRFVIALRSVPSGSECRVNCPVCGGSASGNGPWTCNSCGMMWQ
jgi:phage/plasmid primase-like uncharacterized protein